MTDGQGDVAGLEDPGTMQAAYDFCPTGNEADLASTTPTAVALGNPLRQFMEVYDDLTKGYFLTSGVIREDYSGTSTQGPAFANGDALRRARSASSLNPGVFIPGTVTFSTFSAAEEPSALSVDWGQFAAGSAAVIGGVAAATGGALAVVASPSCGPAAPACAAAGYLGVVAGVSSVIGGSIAIAQSIKVNPIDIAPPPD